MIGSLLSWLCTKETFSIVLPGTLRVKREKGKLLESKQLCSNPGSTIENTQFIGPTPANIPNFNVWLTFFSLPQVLNKKSD
jgi:hypothetical protein